MSERARPTNDRADVSCRAPERAHAGPSTLRLTVVEYEERPNRGTVHPPDLTGVELMESWLSADISAFVELGARR